LEELNYNTLICDSCKNIVKDDDDFCPECGALFADEIFCENHHNIPADGVCIICTLPFCKKCGTIINKHFLCNIHSNYEIYEGMVRVYGSLDDVAVQYAKSCLEQVGLHPVLFCRDQPMGGPRFVYSLFEAKGDYLGHIVNEIKVMVPAQEVIKTEETLKSLNILE
jgi:RNA polymerase subunit RPABC4/transcription elongation factor Spt4